jgi:glycosyltransferase involved in cell wall biosynthesis
MCAQGRTVHLFCQENHPERYNFISEAYSYAKDGTAEQVLRRNTPYHGKCIMHKAELGETLPVFVWDKYEEFARVVPMIELGTEEIEDYLDRNVEVLSKIVEKWEITDILANHAILMSEVARRLKDSIGISYSIMVHGSALTYSVEKDERLYAIARGAFKEAKRIFAIGDESRNRIVQLFPSDVDLKGKIVNIKLGVDTEAFRPVSRKSRKANIERLVERLSILERGKGMEVMRGIYERMDADLGKNELVEMLARARDYDGKCPDEGLEGNILKVNWESDKVIVYVGRLIGNKGVQSLVLSLPLIIEKHPGTKLIIVGHGPLREVLELLVRSMKSGGKQLLKRIIEWGPELEGAGQEPFSELRHFIDSLEGSGKLDSYMENVARNLGDSVLFTGYLTHDELKFLLPCADLAVFPSKVTEAGPLVFLEALSSGVLPLGTNFGGMAQTIDSTGQYLPSEITDMMKIDPDDKRMVKEIADRAIKALDIGSEYVDSMRKMAVEQYDWKMISQSILSKIG